MEFSIKSGNPEKQRYGCVVVGVFETGQLTPAATELDRLSASHLTTIIQQENFDGTIGKTLLMHHLPALPNQRVLLIGLGKEKEFRDKEYGTALRATMKALKDSAAEDALITLTTLPVRKRGLSWKIRQTAIIAQESTYRFDQFKSQKKDKPATLRHLILVAESKKEMEAAERALTEGLAIAEGIALAKTLGNLPGNVCTPSHLADTALQMAGEHGIDCQILDREEMEQLGMHSLLSVARGSHQPPKFIVLHYKPANARNKKPLVLIGKGITFDSGGISLKPGEGMDEMKFDMCGAASVLGTLKAAVRMQLPLDIVAIVPTCENMPGSRASKPGDIVTSMSGQSIEILNTDAEGRLILCDALTYAERFKPDTVIDVATLTGACVIALGHVASGLFANDEKLARALRDAGEESLDRAWQLPLWDDYQDQLKSNFADMANIGGRPAGSVTAACFLSRFAKKFDWAHLDIAGTAWKSGAEKGATGRPVPLLAHYLLDRAGRLD